MWPHRTGNNYLRHLIRISVRELRDERGSHPWKGSPAQRRPASTPSPDTTSTASSITDTYT
jgi:hypothetical protein